MRVLLRQLAELRAVLTLAGKEIVKLNLGKRDTELLKIMASGSGKRNGRRSGLRQRKTAV